MKNSRERLTGRLNIILRDREQIHLLRACVERLSMARGGIKLSAIQALMELARLYLERADEIDPVSPAIRNLVTTSDR